MKKKKVKWGQMTKRDSTPVLPALQNIIAPFSFCSNRHSAQNASGFQRENVSAPKSRIEL